MKRGAWILPTLALSAALSGCVEGPTGPRSSPDRLPLAISDAANAGRVGFYFRPPIAPTVPYPGTFDPTLLSVLSIRICPIDGAGACTGPDVAVLTPSSTPPLTVDLSGESYGATWTRTRVGSFRARVHGGAVELGFADIRVVNKGSELRTVPAGFYGAVQNSSVPIRFRIETGTIGRISVAPAYTTIPVGVDQDFTATVHDLHGNPMAGLTVDWTVEPSTLASVVPTSGVTDGSGQTGTTATGADAGSGKVRASSGGASGAATLAVVDPTTIVGYSQVQIPRADACGQAAGRICESKVGNAITDALRATYAVDFALLNSGGIRADLTCPPVDNPSDSCPPFTPPPFPITRGQVFTVLPFGNRAFTVDVTGAELKGLLENSVSAMPAANGRFAQVSGLCFTYDIAATAGSRVTGAVRAAADGSCTGTPVDLTPAGSYPILISDFMAGGGDQYPNLSARGTAREVLDQVVADHIAANTPISPTIQGRIACTSSSAIACPSILP